MPGSSARLSGSDTDEPLNPDDADKVAPDAVRRLWRSSGFVVDVYCPGSSKTSVDPPGAESVAPTDNKVRVWGVIWDRRAH